ncbi:MAG: PEP-CTERM sorting domain-containing protein [Nitrospirota bacterium]
MIKKKLLTLCIFLFCIMCLSVPGAMASSGASILYSETNIGGGLWQYDYTFNNTSDAGEYLFSVFFTFAQDTSFTKIALPAGWDGILWDGNTWTTSFTDTYSTDPLYDIAAGNSLGGFSFKVDYRAGNIAYDAYFSDDSIVSGTTAPVAPEPVSSILFAVGGGTLLLRRFTKING